MVKLYNTFYDLDVVKRTKDLVDLPQGMIVKKFNILYGNDISKLSEGSVVMVTDIKLKTLGFFRKNKDEDRFYIRDRGANYELIFMDVTSHTGLDFDAKDYFKEDDEEETKGSSDNKRLGFSGAIKRAQERNNAKKLRYKEDNKEQPKDLGDRMADAIKRDIESYDSSEDKFQGVIGDMVNKPSHYTSGDIEVITYIEQQAKVMYESGTVPPEVIPHICNAIKYISRFQSKGKPVEDLNKSIYYINRAIKNIEYSKE